MIEGRLRSILGLLSSFRAICWTNGIGMDGMVIIGHGSSKSTFGCMYVYAINSHAYQSEVVQGSLPCSPTPEEDSGDCVNIQ